MKLSIIIVHFNTPELLEACLSSIIEKKLPEDWEIVVVDNGSDKPFRLSRPHPHVHVRKNTRNEGFSKANNEGIRISTGEYVLLLNPDTVVSQHAVRFVLNYMEAHRHVGIATCRVNLSTGVLDDACHRGFPTLWNALCHFSGISSLAPHSTLLNGYHRGYQDMDRVHDIDACVGAFMMMRRSSGEEIGWLDEDYFWYGEDIDICYRMKKSGRSVVYIPDVSITHLKGASSGIKKHSEKQSTASASTKKQAQKARFDAMRIFYRKHYRAVYSPVTYWLVMKGIDFLEWTISSYANRN